MKIEKSGFYKTRSGHKAEVLKISNGFAYGIIWNGSYGRPTRWHLKGRVCDSFADGGIVSEWREPISFKFERSIDDRHDVEVLTSVVNQRMKELLPKKGERVRITVEELEESEDQDE